MERQCTHLPRGCPSRHEHPGGGALWQIYHSNGILGCKLSSNLPFSPMRLPCCQGSPGGGGLWQIYHSNGILGCKLSSNLPFSPMRLPCCQGSPGGGGLWQIYHSNCILGCQLSCNLPFSPMRLPSRQGSPGGGKGGIAARGSTPTISEWILVASSFAAKCQKIGHLQLCCKYLFFFLLFQGTRKKPFRSLLPPHNSDMCVRGIMREFHLLQPNRGLNNQQCF